jgi:2-polyprenyl-3-methyl-5-hydroxy-6-metoxy-1,4-benzoquinol methylase
VHADLSNRVGHADERFVPGSSVGQLIELEHVARYWWAGQLAEDRVVLDAGCGVGYGSALLAQCGARSVVGLDISAAAVESAAAAAPANVSFEVGDVHALPYGDGQFDLVVCFEVIEHVTDQLAVLAELARVLAPDGVLAISSPNRGVYPAGNPHHVHEYVPGELRAALSGHFAHVSLARQHAWTASAVLGDDALRSASRDRPLDAQVRTTLALEPGSETYTVALASRVPLAGLSGRVMLGGLDDIRSWLQEISEWRQSAGNASDLARQRAEAAAEIERLRAEAADAVAISEQQRRDNAVLLAELEQVRSALRDVHASLAWRLTKPLRALERRRR